MYSEKYSIDERLVQCKYRYSSQWQISEQIELFHSCHTSASVVMNGKRYGARWGIDKKTLAISGEAYSINPLRRVAGIF